MYRSCQSWLPGTPSGCEGYPWASPAQWRASGWPYSPGLGDVSSVQSQVSAAAAKYGVPEWLALAVAKAESAFNPSAVSSAGAVGVMQLMPSTAAGLNVDPYDTSQNIDGGVKYLSQLLSKYGGDTTKALAAYNAGPGNVDKYGGVPPFPETQSYVQKILSAFTGSTGDSAPVGAADSVDAVDSFLPPIAAGDGLSGLAWAGIGIAGLGLLLAVR